MRWDLANKLLATTLLLSTCTSKAAIIEQLSSRPVQPTMSGRDIHDICVSDIRIAQIVTVGSGRNKIVIVFGSGVCDPAEPKITSVSAAMANDDALDDAVIADKCSSLRAQVSKLRPALSQTAVDYGSVHDARAGPFSITGRDFYGMRSAKGRRMAADWLRATLIAVRPCWNNFREDQTKSVVDRLYTALSVDK